jgi:hypothetical protein
VAETDTSLTTDRAKEQVLFEGRPALLQTVWSYLIALVTVGLALIVYWIKQRNTHYRITNQRVVIEKGFFSKRIEQVDLYRINDYTVDLPFGQRVVGTGNLVLESMDRSTPHLRLDGLSTDVRALYEKIREATEIDKRSRGVRVVDYE